MLGINSTAFSTTLNSLFIYSIQWWSKLLEKPDRSENIDLFCLQTLFNFIMFMKHADACSEYNKYQMKRVVQFLIHF